MKLSLFSMLLFYSFVFCSCKDQGPHPTDMVGHFTVTTTLNEKSDDHNKVKSSVTKVYEEAKSEIAKSIENIKHELDLSKIDTTTVEGKIEYATKKFSKTMAEMGTTMGELGTDLAGLFSDLTTSGVRLGEILLKNMKMEVELQADGDIKFKNTWINIAFMNARWEVKKDKFSLFTDENELPEVFKIKESNQDGFVLDNEHLIIKFAKTKS